MVYFPSIENGGMEKNLFNMFNYISNNNLAKIYLLTNFIEKNIKKNLKKIKLLNMDHQLVFLIIDI